MNQDGHCLNCPSEGCHVHHTKSSHENGAGGGYTLYYLTPSCSHTTTLSKYGFNTILMFPIEGPNKEAILTVGACIWLLGVFMINTLTLTLIIAATL